ncbi:hypothetical protein PISMIDRAFT_687453, partial [Pisolithus microcarpus 441]
YRSNSMRVSVHIFLFVLGTQNRLNSRQATVSKPCGSYWTSSSNRSTHFC